MEMKFKKLWPLIGATCAVLSGSAFADSYQHSSSQSNGGTQSGQDPYQRGSYREITPNAGPRVAHGADVFITADFIWWNAVQNGTQYATTGVDTAKTTPADDLYQSVAAGKTKSVGSEWAPGFKVGIGLNLGHDGWDLLAQYTWLHARNSNSISGAASGEQGLVVGQTFSANTGITTNGVCFNAASASAKWHLHFNVIDLELGRNFYVSQYLTMRPFIGLKGTWQDENLKANFQSDQFKITKADQSTSTEVDATGPFHKNHSFDTWGLGIRSGLNLGFYMSKNWSIYGKVALTNLWTHYHIQHKKDSLENKIADVVNSKVVVHIHNNNETDNTVRHIAEMELGFRWETWFMDDSYHFAIQAGWEEQVWLNWGIFGQPLGQSSHDLTLHGLNLKLRFDF